MRTQILFALALLITCQPVMAADYMMGDGKTVTSESIKSFAESSARRKIESNSAGSTNSWTFSGEFSMDEPEPIDGWGGQWRVTGEAGTRTLSSQGGVSSPAVSFEVIVEYKTGRGLTVIGFSRK